MQEPQTTVRYDWFSRGYRKTTITYYLKETDNNTLEVKVLSHKEEWISDKGY